MADRPDTKTSGTSPPRTKTQGAAPRWLMPVVAWEAVLGIGALLGAVLIATGTLWALSGLARWLVAAAVLVTASSAALAVRDSLAAKHRGRAIGVILNYLVVVLFGFASTVMQKKIRTAFDSMECCHYGKVMRALSILVINIIRVSSLTR